MPRRTLDFYNTITIYVGQAAKTFSRIYLLSLLGYLVSNGSTHRNKYDRFISLSIDGAHLDGDIGITSICEILNVKLIPEYTEKFGKRFFIYDKFILRAFTAMWIGETKEKYEDCNDFKFPLYLWNSTRLQMLSFLMYSTLGCTQQDTSIELKLVSKVTKNEFIRLLTVLNFNYTIHTIYEFVKNVGSVHTYVLSIIPTT